MPPSVSSTSDIRSPSASFPRRAACFSAFAIRLMSQPLTGKKTSAKTVNSQLMANRVASESKMTSGDLNSVSMVPMMLNSTSLRSFVIRLSVSPRRASVNQPTGSSRRRSNNAVRRSREMPVRMVAKLNSAAYCTAFFTTASTTMATQSIKSACSAPCSATYPSKPELMRSSSPGSAAGAAGWAGAAAGTKRMRRKGTTLRKVNSESTAPRALNTMLKASGPRYRASNSATSRTRLIPAAPPPNVLNTPCT